MLMLVAVGAVVSVASGCTAHFEKHGTLETWIERGRADGEAACEEHLLPGAPAGPGRDVVGYAKVLLPFAQIASFAYCADPVFDKGERDSHHCYPPDKPPPELVGWALLGDQKSLMRHPKSPDINMPLTRLTFSGWCRKLNSNESLIVIAFRGTNGKSSSDWWANAHWLQRGLSQHFGGDQYDVLGFHSEEKITKEHQNEQVNIPNEIIGKLIEKSREPCGDGKAIIIATGHSLGGGLAQFFARAHRDVYGAIAFDPSPVSGLVETEMQSFTETSPRIIRVYERGEVLTFPRWFVQGISPFGPNVLQMQYDLIEGPGPVSNHAMRVFAENIKTQLDKQAHVGSSNLDPFTSDWQSIFPERASAATVAAGDKTCPQGMKPASRW